MNVKLKDLIDKNNIIPKKSLGQNFIFDYNILDKIAKSLIPLQEHTTLEIGPGPGGLSRSILKCSPDKLIMVEKDLTYKKLLANLGKEFNKTKITLIIEDFLKFDLKRFNKEPLKIYSNLPYYISTQILMKLLPLNKYNISEVAFTFQKEVAERILALPGTKNYSRLSVLTQYACKIKKICTLPAKVFYPIPKVDSLAIKFMPNKNTNINTFSYLQSITKLAFGKRRKMLRNSLSNLVNISDALKNCEIKDTARAEDLSIEQFVRLSDKINS